MWRVQPASTRFGRSRHRPTGSERAASGVATGSRLATCSREISAVSLGRTPGVAHEERLDIAFDSRLGDRVNLRGLAERIGLLEQTRDLQTSWTNPPAYRVRRIVYACIICLLRIDLGGHKPEQSDLPVRDGWLTLAKDLSAPFGSAPSAGARSIPAESPPNIWN